MSVPAEHIPSTALTTSGVDHWIELAITKGADVEQLSKLMDLKERYDAQEARRAYNEAMRRVQAEMPRIKKDAKNEQTQSMYARLDTISKALIPVYTLHGFALSFSEQPATKDHYVRVCCDIYHSGGHTEHKCAELPIDDVGIKGTVNKTQVHATASTWSYAQRYLTLLVFNVAPEESDDDGQAAGNGQLESLGRHNATVRDCFTSLYVIKQAIADGDLGIAVEAWAELQEDEQRALWLAPSKGGIFTTQERTIMKSDAWGEARRIHIGDQT